jgi:hypothetical protein
MDECGDGGGGGARKVKGWGCEKTPGTRTGGMKERRPEQPIYPHFFSPFFLSFSSILFSRRRSLAMSVVHQAMPESCVLRPAWMDTFRLPQLEDVSPDLLNTRDKQIDQLHLSTMISEMTMVVRTRGRHPIAACLPTHCASAESSRFLRRRAALRGSFANESTCVTAEPSHKIADAVCRKRRGPEVPPSSLGTYGNIIPVRCSEPIDHCELVAAASASEVEISGSAASSQKICNTKASRT